MAYLRDTLPLSIKGRFYVMFPFYSKGKISHHSLLYVLNGKILCLTNGIKSNSSNLYSIIHNGKIYAKPHTLHNTRILPLTDIVSMETIKSCVLDNHDNKNKYSDRWQRCSFLQTFTLWPGSKAAAKKIFIQVSRSY